MDQTTIEIGDVFQWDSEPHRLRILEKIGSSTYRYEAEDKSPLPEGHSGNLTLPWPGIRKVKSAIRPPDALPTERPEEHTDATRTP